MFARHTQSRMKVSNVLGWKSFVDKLHPQLPLTTKESQRLLTALTSSFRKHLDDAHPLPSAEDERKAGPDMGVAKPQTRTWHSSASHADKHLASVLTSPLLVKGGKRLDHAFAKAELARNPSKDPIELLEEYQQQHAASVAIAALCLETIKARLNVLAPDKQTEFIQDLQPGRRVFLWLLNSGLDDSSSYVDDVAFMCLMVHFLIKEGREHNIWEWIKIDAQLAGTVPMTTAARSRDKPMLHAYRWRGRLLRALMKEKLGTESGRRHELTKVHEAFDAFFKACEIKTAAPRHHHLYWIPLGPAYVDLSKEMTFDSYKIRSDIDPNRLDKLISYIPLTFQGSSPIYAKMAAAQLHLVHPRQSSADPAYGVLHDLFGDIRTVDRSTLIDQFVAPRTPGQARYWTIFVARTISTLQAQGRIEDASWLQSAVRRRCPDIARELTSYLTEFKSDNQTARDYEEQEQEREQPRIRYPTFA
ncbi:hypothetical protein M409DRAFT_22017 [Zasmidium cellare ATCC 36951]|uniref:Uncharacterized protein n=1 Tax=Zasmidium cellare ATCC 36951 TaxID=1080233 RepID=A0A6A6CQ24_ZASCE|nr:uncharacterized protein M409DRAFT_22017 [Zasmidium cellare ATCC 36951]KAF2167869.1 hypothetical protein M409DRAFT_22017 [Zasmidium cellare ATCC 36951]